jgi:hypothetical protein
LLPIILARAAVAAVPHAHDPNHFALAGLRRFRSVDAFEPDARLADGNGVTVDDPGMAR